MSGEKHDPTITIAPSICAAKGERHPQWVALILPVELAHCGGDIEDITEAVGFLLYDRRASGLAPLWLPGSSCCSKSVVSGSRRGVP